MPRVNDSHCNHGVSLDDPCYECSQETRASDADQGNLLLPTEYLCIDPQGKLNEAHLQLCLRCQEAGNVWRSITEAELTTRASDASKEYVRGLQVMADSWEHQEPPDYKNDAAEQGWNDAVTYCAEEVRALISQALYGGKNQ